jgi:hypothetical protein
MCALSQCSWGALQTETRLADVLCVLILYPTPMITFICLGFLCTFPLTFKQFQGDYVVILSSAMYGREKRYTFFWVCNLYNVCLFRRHD